MRARIRISLHHVDTRRLPLARFCLLLLLWHLLLCQSLLLLLLLGNKLIYLTLRNDHYHLSVRCLLQIDGLALECLRHFNEFLLLDLLVTHLTFLLLCCDALADVWQVLLYALLLLLLDLLLELLLVMLLQLLLYRSIDLLDTHARILLHQVLLLLLDNGCLLGPLVLDLLLLLEALSDLFVGPGLSLCCDLRVGWLLTDALLHWLILLHLSLLRLALHKRSVLRARPDLRDHLLLLSVLSFHDYQPLRLYLLLCEHQFLDLLLT